ncbi:hypothetical protein TEA_013428 [Camellia sinensis var. sinensis]|uniref:Uncharacterized protein n=1 Tax=Camellia sinensis var. sinensis TaxID=542762 RepID=A0A4S4DFA0_CAMSN|nr:hypothetical protein TEA_013428 [Camellia sinensis var. sinensis]
MIGDEDINPSTILELIDGIQRLGLSYHFEEDIRSALNRIMFAQRTNVRLEKGIHAIALYFRLCRQHGFEVSQGTKFKDHDGNFKQWLCEDVKGLLSLYEAPHLAFDGENILDEAKVFTTKHLKGIKGNIDTTLMQQIKHALELPFHYRMLRLEASWYIQAYSERRDANHLLLELSKLDFNMVQSKLQRELQQMSSSCRKGLTKVTALITTIDDVYDVYGSLDELELFTAAVERWDTNVVETQLHEVMLPSSLQHYLCKAFLVEAKWCFNKETPTFEAYLENAWRSVSGVAKLERGESANSILCHMKENGVSEQFAWKHISNFIDETWKKMNKDQHAILSVASVLPTAQPTTHHPTHPAHRSAALTVALSPI